MRLLIISGRSGSGKTVSIHLLEDLGFYCVDNLPVDMLPSLVKKLESSHPKLAVSIDSRNLPKDENQLKSVIAELKKPNIECDIIYLDANENYLLQRYSETRRRHPLTTDTVSLKDAISQEKVLLSPISNMADHVIDTSKLSKHELCSILRDRIMKEGKQNLQLLIQSFGFKNGIPVDADFVFDVRCLPNPYWQPKLRHLSGLDELVANYLQEQPTVELMVADILTFLDNWIPRFEKDNRSYLTVGIGCTGGQHRSVYIANTLCQGAKKKEYQVQIRHRDLKQKS